MFFIASIFIVYCCFIAATDDDRPKDTLRFQVLRSWSGNVTLLTDQRTPLQYFTQELIDRNLVAFCHKSKYF